MIYRICSDKDISKVEQLFNQQEIEYERAQYPEELLIRDDFDNIIYTYDEYENIDPKTISLSKSYVVDQMLNDCDWSEYLTTLQYYIDEGIKKFSK